MKRSSGIKAFHPINIVLMSFIILIMAGALCLSLPFAANCPVSFLDALFTSTSAVCVTGLTVLDTSKDYSPAGQAVILTLIQLGGLGIMTFSMALVAIIGGSFSIKWRFTMESMYSGNIAFPIKSIFKRILLYTFSIEAAAAAILFTQFAVRYDFPTAAWHAVFHSISSFCNAGFSTFPDSLTAYRPNPVVNLASALTIILGGLGFVVLTELFNARVTSRRNFFRQFSLHTRIVIVMTLLLVFAGTAAILTIEWNRLFNDFSTGEKILAGFYQSVTCRTAGFNTVDIGSLSEQTLFVMMALMFIGGSPGSIAGGVKTTTIAVIVGLLVSRLRGRRQVVFSGRALGRDTVERSMALVLMAITFICTAVFVLMVVTAESFTRPLLDAMFEVVSAFGTVGLSTGVTPHLNAAGKIVLIVVMYVGRLGPLTLFAALTTTKRVAPVAYAEEHILIG